MNNYIQWKGTDVCIDIHCPECETGSHFDGYFMYQYECPKCKSVFQMGESVEMIKLDKPNEKLCEPVSGDKNL